jgi:hypothetical protein
VTLPERRWRQRKQAKKRHEVDVGKKSHKLFKTVPITVLTLSVVDWVKRDLADPAFASGWRFGLQPTPPEGPTEWNETFFANNHILYQENKSFWHMQLFFCVGDFVMVEDSATPYEIQELRYKIAEDDVLKVTTDLDMGDMGERQTDQYRDDLIPKLTFRARSSRLAANREGSAKALPSGLPTEIVLCHDDEKKEQWLHVDQITGKATVLGIAEEPSDVEAASIIRRSLEQSFVCRYTEDPQADEVQPYCPPPPPTWHSPHLDEPDVVVVWYSSFTDKFTTPNTQNDASINGKYIQYQNWNAAFRKSQATIRVVCAVPNKCDIVAVGRAGEEECKLAAEKGFDCFVAAKNRVMRVYLLPALLIADHIQAVETVRHLGNQALRNGRNSLVRVTHRRDSTIDIRDHKITRRWEQTLCFVKQQLRRAELLKIPAGGAHDRILRRSSGVDHRTRSAVEDGPRQDPNESGMYDCNHLLEKCFLQIAYQGLYAAVSPAIRERLRRLLSDFPWPKGVTRPMMSFTTEKKPYKTMSWDHTKKIVMSSLVRLCGMFEYVDIRKAKQKYLYFCRLSLWSFEMMGPVPLDRYAALQKESDYLVKKGTELYPDEYDIPNVLGIRELAYKVLPALGNCSFAMTAKYEGHHKEIRPMSGRGGTRPDLTVMRLIAKRAAAATAARGGVWKWKKDGRDIRLGSSFAALRDDNNPQRPHAVMNITAEDFYPGFRTATMEDVSHPTTGARLFAGQRWTPVQGKGKVKAVTLSAGNFTRLLAGFEQNTVAKDWPRPTKDSVIEYITGMRSSHFTHDLTVYVGDDFSCKYQVDQQSSVEYCSVRRLMRVTTTTTTGTTTGVHQSMWVVPLWYFPSTKPKELGSVTRNTQAESMYRHLKAPIVYQKNENYDPFPADLLLAQVLVVHACLRQTFAALGKPTADKPPAGTCYLRSYCNTHARWECRICEVANQHERDFHCETNLALVVLTTLQGFHPFYRVSHRIFGAQP